MSSSKSPTRSQPVSLVTGRPGIGAPALSTPSNVITLAERAHETITITELEPDNGTFIGKHINRDGSITQYPTVKWWRQHVAQIPASIPHVFAYLRDARTRNICLIRGAPAKAERQPTRRQKAGVVGSKDRGDHGFVDEPSKLFWCDVDGAPMMWKGDPEGGVKAIVAQLGEPWTSTSYVWFFSATHGLEFDEHKCWTGKIGNGTVRVRLVFITERALNEAEASALTSIAQVHVPKLDRSVCYCVQPNYIKRPHWVEHPDRDVLGNIPTIGWVRGARDYLTVPDNLTHQARWAKAQGHHVDIADHPDAESAVRGIGSDGRVRQHLLAAVEHLLRVNPAPEVVSFADHSIAIADQLEGMVEQHRAEIEQHLARHHRHWSEVLYYLAGMADYAHWCLDHPTALSRKTIRLVKEEPAETDDVVTREMIFARVARTIEQFSNPNLFEAYGDEFIPTVMLLVAPTGSRKSTEVRANAVRRVEEHPKKTVVILMPRHRLGAEQIDMLQQEHPGGNYNAAVWRGRHADDPNSPDPNRSGKFMKMCRRSAAAEELEKAMLNVEHHLCKQGRGAEAIKCPYYDGCAYQLQKQIEANIWFAAHECAVHEMPKTFGDVGWVIFDESPLDAFMFGVDVNDQIKLELDMLLPPLTPAFYEDDNLQTDAQAFLIPGREALHEALNKLRVPFDQHKGVPASKQSLGKFIRETLYGARARKWRKQHDKFFRTFTRGGIRLHYGVASTGPILLPRKYDAQKLYGLEWRGKIVPDIKPNMTKEQAEKELDKAKSNGGIKKYATLWQLIEQVHRADEKLHDLIQQAKGDKRRQLIKQASEDKLCGRIQVHRGDEGRIIRMVGLKPLAKGWNVRTLICDATGDAKLLRAIWPQLETDESVQGWQQMPRPNSVRVFQCVDRTISKWAVAVEAKNEKELARKIEGARRLYAALLLKALEYGGAEVGVIIYKSTREWIEQNCAVPEWLKLVHWGDVTGSNALEHVRALFAVGRPFAAPEDVARQVEALFGEYVPEREYRVRRKHGRIPIVPDAKGNNCILVDVREMTDPMGQRVQRQITQASVIQAAGRARAGLRGEDDPLDLHLWTDVAVPELGPVEPVLWSELEAGLDGLMLASGGVWLESAAHAVRAYKGLFTVDGLRSSRKTSGGVFLIGTPISRTPPLLLVRYQKAGQRQRAVRALVLAGIDGRAWLGDRLGSLACFEVEGGEEAKGAM